MSIWTAFLRGCRLRCPRCGQGKLFLGWFKMSQRCSHCNLLYDRGPGYFLGSIYINYGLTALLVVVGYFSIYFSEVLSPQTALWTLAAFSVVFPLLFFRHARSLWMGFDQYFDPQEVESGEEANKGEDLTPT